MQPLLADGAAPSFSTTSTADLKNAVHIAGGIWLALLLDIVIGNRFALCINEVSCMCDELPCISCDLYLAHNHQSERLDNV